MSLQSNRISIVLDDAMLAEIRKKFEELEALLNFAIGLTVEERVSMPKINVANRTFVMDSQAALQTNPGFMPAYVNVPEMGKDINLFNQLSPWLVFPHFLIKIFYIPNAPAWSPTSRNQ